jgi:uncharacterized protein YpuA (DUF1002 family)
MWFVLPNALVPQHSMRGIKLSSVADCASIKMWEPRISRKSPVTSPFIVDGIVDDLAYTIGVNRTALNVVCPAECSGTTALW